MNDRESEDKERSELFWVAVAAGAVLGLGGMVWFFHYRQPSRRVSRLLRRCQERIQDIESSLASLESSLQSTSP